MNRHGSMNRVYRLVWSQARSAWVPAAENAKGRGKSGRTRASVIARLTAPLLSMLVPMTHAAPTGGQVVSGKGSISQSGSTTTVKQSSQTLAVDWQSFNIAPQETVDFVQPSATSVAVNRVLGTDGSQILGHLNANGQVYLINPNGILFGKGSEVNVGGLVASTLNLTSEGLGSTHFAGSSTAGVTNEGMINAASGGYVASVGNHVSNQGAITAELGTVALGAGSGVTLTFAGSSLVHLQVDQSVLKSEAQNGGLIQANGGHVLMTAGAKDALLASVVNNTGVIEARTVENHEGTITLLGGMTAGKVTIGGTLDASAPQSGNGGSIETSAAHVEVANDARITTLAAHGLTGSWLVDPQDFTVASSGGDITGAILSSELGSTSVTLQSSSGANAGSGNVNVNDTVAWAANTILTLTASNNVNVNSNITATGASAGLALNPNMANGTETPSGTGTFNLGAGASINLPMVSPSSTTALTIGGMSYTVINSLGAPGSKTGTDLQGIEGNLRGRYALGSNIDATPTSGWNGGEGFSPIGNTASSAFIGTFDGLGHTITDLVINRPSSGNVGLFGYLESGATLSDVGLLNVTVVGGKRVGALVGTGTGGTINNSYVTGSIRGDLYVGGLAGLLNAYQGGIAISNSHSAASVEGNDYVGGLAGSASYSIINSYFTGTVKGTVGVGGLVGEFGGELSNSHMSGNVFGSGTVGGLVGDLSGSITNSYVAGNVAGTSAVGGLVGFTYGGFISGSSITGIVHGFNNVGGVVGIGYSAQVSNSYSTGNVCGTNSVGGMAGLTYGGARFTNTHSTGAISGTSMVGGLVGNGESGTSITSSFATGTVAGSTDVGGLAGISEASSYINQSYASGNVIGTGTGVGGLVGLSTSTTVNQSYAAGSVRGSGQVGGLVGNNEAYGVVTDSYSVGAVSGSTDVGGLVGSNAGTVNNSFWNVTTSGLSRSAGGTGMTTAQMQTRANFISATPANGNVNPHWDFINTWIMYNGHTYPLLATFLAPTVAGSSDDVPHAAATYSGSGGLDMINSVTRSSDPSADVERRRERSLVQ